MFEEDLATLSTADLLESAAEHRAVVNRAEARLLEHAQIYADRYHPDKCPTRPGRRSCDGRERPVVLGGEGCPEIAEFAIAEFGVILGISPRVAADYLGHALALRHRFPFTWARVQAGDATAWKARRIVADCTKLSEEAARYVDRRIAPIIDSITPYRLEKIVNAAKNHADPELARAETDEKTRERGVYVGQSDDRGTKTIYIRTASSNATRHDATIANIADALKIFGDTRPVQHRRSDAVGIIADPCYTQELLRRARHEAGNTPAATATAKTAPLTPPAGPAAGRRDHIALGRAADSQSYDDELLVDRTKDWIEPGLNDEADREAPPPSATGMPDPLDTQRATPIEPYDPNLHLDLDDGEPMDAAAQRALHARLAQIKHDAYTSPSTAGGRLRPGKTEIYVHLTDHTLATGSGVLRAESIGPLLADQLTELVGHGPYVVKPVIDLNGAISVDAYEIPDRIRERVRLANPVELFPFGTRETHPGMDLDHIQPYDPLGPPGQTNTQNLAPLGRYTHRVKTHAPGWSVRRIDHKTLEWTTPHGFTYRVTPTGTRRVDTP
ncbi:DUF222 domain-containing protein [Kribbella sp. NPDC051952]|uniref:DUF222 domain-containing protein n=1 Tax=Kribbella sp. NPDC051952 TaxID=3154851 RepID=UPI003446D56E